MYRTLALSVLMCLMLAGCEVTSQTSERQRPSGVPANAELIGGGLSEDLQFDRNGRLIVVDPKTNAGIATFQVRSGEPVRMDMDTTVGSLMMARYGPKGLVMARSILGGRDQKELDPATMPNDSITLELYFIPAHGEANEKPMKAGR